MEHVWFVCQFSPQLGYYNPYYSTQSTDVAYTTYPQPAELSYPQPAELSYPQLDELSYPQPVQAIEAAYPQLVDTAAYPQPVEDTYLSPQAVQLPEQDPRLQTYNGIPTLPFPGYKSPFHQPPASLGYNEAVPTVSTALSKSRKRRPLVRPPVRDSESSVCGPNCHKKNAMYIVTLVIAVLTIAVIIVVAVLARGECERAVEMGVELSCFTVMLTKVKLCVEFGIT